jgi:hypothetical protein
VVVGTIGTKELKMHEYEIVVRVTLPRPMETMIPDSEDRSLANIQDAAEKVVMEIKEVIPS